MSQNHPEPRRPRHPTLTPHESLRLTCNWPWRLAVSHGDSRAPPGGKLHQRSHVPAQTVALIGHSVVEGTPQRRVRQADRYQRVSGFDQVPDQLRAGYRPSPERPMSRVLTPFDAGIPFETDGIHERDLAGPYPVVRWTDR